MAENNGLKVPRRVLGLLLSSISAGVVPRVGASYIAIGRNEEITALVKDLDFVADGGSAMRFIVGKYGSGKSFLITLMRGYAMDRDFVTADVDLSPERKLCASNGSGSATYRELMRNICIKTSPEGGALPTVISKWLSSLSMELVKQGLAPDSESFDIAMRSRVFDICSELEGNVGGFDFARVLSLYYKASKNRDDELKSSCMRWFFGEYTTKTEAKAALKVSEIINDNNWYDYLKLWAVFFKKIGYRGFAVFIDECVNLYKISNRISREKNYEKLLSMFNDSLGGRSTGLALFFGGTPQFLEDTRRGLYSYEALRSRLADGRYAVGEYRNLMGPVIRLRRMSDNELLALVNRVSILHGQYYGQECRVTADERTLFCKICLERAGADTMITPREMIREYITVLDIMLQNPSASFMSIIGGDGKGIDLKNKQESDEIEIEGFDEFDDL